MYWLWWPCARTPEGSNLGAGGRRRGRLCDGPPPRGRTDGRARWVLGWGGGCVAAWW